ncbi:unnamed protein product, partial [Prorocentrum cordatum]
MWRNNPDLHDHLRGGRLAVKRHLGKVTKRGRWQAATGTMAALQLTLELPGWTAQEPDKWTDHAGTQWQISDNLTEVEEAIKEAAAISFWKQASRHPEGQGLHEGAKVRSIRASARHVRKPERRQGAGALGAAACAATWTNQKCHAAGNKTAATCTRCELGINDTPSHRFYERPGTKEIEHPWVESTPVTWVPEHLQYATTPWRQMCPVDPPTPPQWDSLDNEFSTVSGEHFQWERGTTSATRAFTDGSITTSGKRTGRAGWGVALKLLDGAEGYSRHDTSPGWFGILDGDQTIGAAELTAIMWTLKFTKGHMDIISDSQMVVDGWHSFNYMNPSGPLARWWHRTRQPMDVTRGNEMADGYAQRGAETAANLTAPQVEAPNQRERLLRRVHRRIGAATSHIARMVHPKLERDRRAGAHGKSFEHRKQMEATTGHCLHKQADGKWVRLECGKGPGKYSVTDWMQNNACSSMPMIANLHDHATAVIKSEYAKLLPNAAIHTSHNLGYLHGQCWCWTCGAKGSLKTNGCRRVLRLK